MSRWNTKADRIATFLADLPEMEEIPVSVHRAGDLITQVSQRMAKDQGTGTVIIKWLGGTNPDRKSNRLRIGARFSISLWTHALRNEGTESPADDLIEAIGEQLHGWVDPTPGSLVHRLEVTSINLVPDAPNYIVHEILAEMTRV